VLYIATDSSRQYRWDSSNVYVEIGPDSGSTLWALWLPPAPTGLAATAGSASASLSWTAPTVSPQTPVIDYRVQFSSNGGTTWTTYADGVTTSTIANVTGLTNGTSYVFRVAAINAIGQGAYTSQSSSVMPGFAPASVAGLQLWYDASDASSLFDAASGGSLVAADGAVARWQDKSGNARHATQATSGNRPIRKINQRSGLDAIQFDGTNDFLSLESIEIPASHSVFQVYQRLGGVQSFGIAGEPSRYAALWFSDGVLYQISNANFTTHGTSSDSTGYFLVSTIRNSTASIELRRNGSTVSSVTTGSGVTNAASGEWTYIGNRTAGNFHSGNLCEIIVYNTALSDSNRAAVESYLMAKWGIS
jgi:hypothetical protein